MTTSPRRYGRSASWALLAALLVSTACGSNSGVKRALERQAAAPAPAAASAPQGTIPNAPAAMPADPGAPAPSAAASEAAAPAAPRPASEAPRGSTSASAQPRQATASPPGRPSGQPAGRSDSADAPKATPSLPAPGPAPGAPQRPGATGPKSTIIIGSIGSDSGVLGQVLLAHLQGAKAWAGDVNARGGLNGHPVKVLFADDGGEPSRALALAKRMVDQDKAVAFYAHRGPGTADAINGYLEQVKVPVIGECACSVSGAKSPMVFPVGPAGGLGLTWAHVLPLLNLSDKRNVSVLYCRESPSCKAGRDTVVNEIAKQVGLVIRHEAQVTISQPDYTAEVLAAKNAGADAFILFVDNFSVIRLARSAHRQGWNPVLSGQFSSHDERTLSAGGNDVEGVLFSAAMPHWTSPILADYRAAMQKYVPGGVLASWGEMAWAAGKLMELISKDFPEQPTSADFIHGLYALRGETLGGLIPPLAYREGQGHDESNLCAIPVTVKNGKFHAPRGDNFACASGWSPITK